MPPSSSDIPTLLSQLKDTEPSIREQATESLWQTWFWQKGLAGLQQLQQSQSLIEQGQMSAAETALDQLIHDHPDFAEAWNRRAVFHYLNDNFDLAIHDCRKTLELVPFHFGALHGLGLCYAAQGDLKAAIQAFQRALEIQPHALLNKKLMLECLAQL